MASFLFETSSLLKWRSGFSQTRVYAWNWSSWKCSASPAPRWECERGSVLSRMFRSKNADTDVSPNISNSLTTLCRKGHYRVGSLPLIIQCSYYHPTKKRRGFKFSCVKPWFVGSMEAKQNRMSPRCKHTAVVVFQRLPKWDWIFFKKKSEIGHPHTVNKCTDKDVCISAIFYPITIFLFFTWKQWSCLNLEGKS